ncbi:hypothetical protein V2J09_013175 [Rumex salicifolius]
MSDKGNLNMHLISMLVSSSSSSSETPVPKNISGGGYTSIYVGLIMYVVHDQSIYIVGIRSGKIDL